METKRELSLEECKSRTQALFERFTVFCEENGLRYYTAYGSCIGAMRHGGFIPWDDDVDVSMPREDYNRLIRMLVDNASPQLRLFAPGDPAQYWLYYVKVTDPATQLESDYMRDIPGMGLFVDVFPMDEANLTPEQIAPIEKKMVSCIKHLRLSNMTRYWPSKNPVKNVIKRLIFADAQRRGGAYWYNKLQRIICAAKARPASPDTAPYYLCGFTAIDKSLFGEGTLQTFEDFQVRVPEKTDAYLTKLYGDWRRLPPEEARVTTHDFHAYLTEETAEAAPLPRTPQDLHDEK